MFNGGRRINERTIRIVFDVGLWFKGAFALTEIVGGVAAYFLTQGFLVELASKITRGELKEDPHDLLATYLLHGVQNLSLSTRYFAAAYLFGHGVIKLWLIIGLLRRRLRYYPAALIVFGFFIIYQIYRFYFTHSPWLVAVTVVDVMVIALTWHEYRYLQGLSRPGIR